MALAKLKKVDLREAWRHEASDFTRWLAQDENLTLLGEEIEIDLQLTAIEANVGAFSVDILAQEEGTTRKVIIENQLEITNHDHLGKLITYASGHDAEIVVWVVKDAREEHRQAIDWLNEHTNEKLGFFLVKIELYQIDDSRMAPKFEVLASPNEWAKVLKASAGGDTLTETKLQQLDFWTKFKEFAQKKKGPINFGRTPHPQHWYNVSVGSSGAHIALTLDTRKSTLGCDLYIDRDKDLFHSLQEKKIDVESELGEAAEWVDASVASRIKVKKEVVDIFEPKNLEQNFEWMYQKVLLFHKVFAKRVREFKVE